MPETTKNEFQLSTHQCLVIWQALTDYVDSGIYTPANVGIAEQLREAMLTGNPEATPPNLVKHNHEWVYEEGYRTVGECARCDQLRAEKQAMGETPHNHEAMPFGRRVAGCPRCAELAKGAPARRGFNNRRWR